MHSHLKTSNFNSFRRQLSLYGFNREKHSSKKPVFLHPLFRQGERELLNQIGRAKQTKMRSRFVVNSVLIKSCEIQLTKISKDYKADALTESKMEFIEHIKSLDKYVGIGIVKFMKNLIRLLNKAFPGIEQQMIKEIVEAQEILYQTHFIKPAEIVNKKEILIVLINGILTAIHKDLKEESQNTEEDMSNGNFSTFSANNISFDRICLDDLGHKQTPRFVEDNPSKLLSPVLEHQFFIFGQSQPRPNDSLRKQSLF